VVDQVAAMNLNQPIYQMTVETLAAGVEWRATNDSTSGFTR